jgi:dihydrofolate reductase
MRKLKLQVQMTLDGFVGRQDGGLDWMSTDADEQALALVNKIADESDVIIMGRKMSPGFLEYWEGVVDNNKNSPEYGLAKRMVDKPKVIFSKTQKSTKGRNARVENGDLRTEIMKMKNQPGKDILVYGGANFVSNLIKEDLIDEYYLFVNPTAIGSGLRIFEDTRKLKFIDSKAYSNGEVVNHYKTLR